MTAGEQKAAALKAVVASGKQAQPPQQAKREVKIKIHLQSGITVEGIHKTAAVGTREILSEFEAMQPLLALQIPDKPHSVVLVSKKAIEALRIYGD